MMMHGNNHDLGAGRAIDDRVREPSHQTATMFTMYLAEALGMLAALVVVINVAVYLWPRRRIDPRPLVGA